MPSISFLLVSFGFLLTDPSYGDPLLKLQTEARLNRQIEGLQRCTKMNAISLAIVGRDRDGQPAKFSKGYGYLSPRSHTKVTPDTVFCIGQCTRGFTSTLLGMLLSENEKYQWTTPLWEMLGDWVKIYDWYRSRNVNLKDILTMRSGVGGLAAAVTHDSLSRRGFLGRMEVATEVMSYREHYIDTQEMYAWIPTVVYKLKPNRTYEDLVRERIFEKIGMKSSIFIHGDLPRTKHVASPTIRIDGRNITVPFQSFSGQKLVASSSSICSSANDMSKWMVFQMGDGRTSSGEVIISQRDLRDTHRFYTVRSDPANAFVEGFRQPDLAVSYTFDSYGLGWIRGIHRGYGTLVHDGSLPGYETLMTLIPSRNVGVYASFTGMSGPEALAAKTVINLLGIQAVLHPSDMWINERNTPCGVYEQLLKAASRSKVEWEGPYEFQPNDTKRELDEYSGVYENMALYKLYIIYNDSRDELTMKYGKLGEYRLHPEDTPGIFRADATGPLFYLTRTNKAEPYVYFSSSKGQRGLIDSVMIPFFDRKAKPVFVKDLVYTDRFATAGCNNARYGRSKATMFSSVPLLIIMACILSYFCTHRNIELISTQF